MIVVSIKGGLGNQLFQYATARSLAEKYNTAIKIDLSFFDYWMDEHRAYRSPSDIVYYHLDNFDIVGTKADRGDIDSVIRFGKRGKRIAEMLTSSRISPYLEPFRQEYGLAGRLLNYYGERTPDQGRFNPAILEAGPSCYLNGYWESPKYFEDIREILVSEFTPATDLSDKSQQVLERIQEKSSVGLHVRRGDLVEFDNALPKAYFERAIAEFDDENVKFFVFSVDPDWVAENIDIDAPVEYVDHYHPDEGTRTPMAWEYLVLMNCCDHKIISNSTFSWWAAWLDCDSNTNILCPAIWRPNYPPDGMKYVRNLDLIPDSWEVIQW
jgi:hypothetical protein